MTSTGAKSRGGWLANYYLRGLIALGIAVVALAAGADDGMPLILGAGAWVALWLASKVREGYEDTERHS